MPTDCTTEVASPATPGALGSWLRAARPKTLPAAVAPVVVGSAVAAREGMLNLNLALITALATTAIQVGTNFANDLFDFHKGADNAARVGPKRAVQQGWVTPRAMAIATAFAFVVAALLGTYLIVAAGPVILAIGIVSILAGLAYTAGPAPLAYVGLGDLFAFVFFGPVATVGTTFVQTGAFSLAALYASLPMGLLITAILVTNNLRDAVGDRDANKRTLVVRFGVGFGRLEYTLLLAASVALPVVLVATSQAPLGWLCPVPTLPWAVHLVQRIYRNKGRELNPMLGMTARYLLVYSALLAIGICI